MSLARPSVFSILIAVVPVCVPSAWGSQPSPELRYLPGPDFYHLDPFPRFQQGLCSQSTTQPKPLSCLKSIRGSPTPAELSPGPLRWHSTLADPWLRFPLPSTAFSLPPVSWGIESPCAALLGILRATWSSRNHCRIARDRSHRGLL